MPQSQEQSVRNRAIWIVRLVTFGGVAGALGVTWGFANLADAYFSGKPPAPPTPPAIPKQATPVQKAPPVTTTIVHHPYQPGARTSGGGGSAPAPPAQGPAAPPPPPPPVVCHSTPSKPC